MPDARFFTDAPILSAEVLYFRIARDDWELMLVRARQLGANTISTYVPWSWHEPQRGTLDLAGHTDPQRDLVGFTRLCGRLGLRLILKPGPFVDAELLGGGIPPWLLHQHPEIHALRPDGEAWRHSDSGLPRACYLHPVYLAAARRWIAAFSQAVSLMQAPDGPVVALQVDNETPGDGMLPADIGLDPRLRLDYNRHVTDELWPQWLRAQARAVGGNAQQPAGAPTSPSPAPPLPRSWKEPRSLDELRAYADLEAFTDWYHTKALATVASWLREEGWTVPLFHDLLAAPWEAGGTIADGPGMARAVGWLGHNVYAEEVREGFVGGAGYRLSFEEYVHYAYWRTGLTRSLSPGYPALVSEISAAQDFFFAAPLLGGAAAINVYVLNQTQPDNVRAGAFVRWAMEAPVRPDGSLRPRFWNAKILFTLLGAMGADFAAAESPADVAIGYSRVPERVGAWGYRFDYLKAGRSWQPQLPELVAAASGADHATRGQLLAQRLVRAGVTFDVLDLDAATPQALARYKLLLVPACGVLAREAQAKLAASPTLMFVGAAGTYYDEHLLTQTAPGDRERLPEDVSSEQIAEIVAARNGIARYAWADAPDVDVTVRHGEQYSYLLIANRRPTPYSGTIAFRSVTNEVLHLHVSLGGLRIGAVALLDDEVIGAAFGGDGAEGGWLARGLFNSIVFNNGAGAVAPCGAGVMLTAPQSGRFQLRRRTGWEGMAAYRLLTSGALLTIPLHTESSHAGLPFTAEDERGQTDMCILLPVGADAPQLLRDYLASLLLARATLIRRLGSSSMTPAARSLEALAARDFNLDEYAIAWGAADSAAELAAEELARELARARGAYAAGAIDETAYAMQERRLAWELGLLARASLANERE